MMSMIMKRWIFKVYLLLCLFSAFSPVINAQEAYEQRINKYKNHWEQLIPTHTKLQYAGGMGIVSVGTGWDYGKNNQWETDVFLGIIPRYSTQHAKATLTVKQNFLPWNKQRINDHFSFDPLACGMYLNTVFDGDFWVSEPDKYPSGYYTFSTKLRFWAFLGQRITLHIPPQKRFMASAITLFYEISSCDLYIASAINNSYLKPSDYLRLSFGIKFQRF